MIVRSPAAAISGFVLVTYKLCIHPYSWVCQATHDAGKTDERTTVCYKQHGLPPAASDHVC